VPTSAVEGSGDSATVTVVGADGTETETTVATGVEGDSGVEIVSGLSEGDTVAITVEESDTDSGTTTFPGGGGMGGTGGGMPGGTGGGGMPGGN